MQRLDPFIHRYGHADGRAGSGPDIAETGPRRKAIRSCRNTSRDSRGKNHANTMRDGSVAMACGTSRQDEGSPLQACPGVPYGTMVRLHSPSHNLLDSKVRVCVTVNSAGTMSSRFHPVLVHIAKIYSGHPRRILARRKRRRYQGLAPRGDGIIPRQIHITPIDFREPFERSPADGGVNNPAGYTVGASV